MTDYRQIRQFSSIRKFKKFLKQKTNYNNKQITCFCLLIAAIGAKDIEKCRRLLKKYNNLT